MEERVSNEATNDLLVAIMERQVKRLFSIIVALLVLLLITNVGWLIYESQFDKVVITQDGTTDSGGDVNLGGVGNGDLYYGESTPDLSSDVIKVSGTGRMFVKDANSNTMLRDTQNISASKSVSLSFNTGTYTSLYIAVYSTTETAAIGDVKYENLLLSLATDTDPT